MPSDLAFEEPTPARTAMDYCKVDGHVPLCRDCPCMVCQGACLRKAREF